MSLFANAIKYSPQGERRAKVTCRPLLVPCYDLVTSAPFVSHEPCHLERARHPIWNMKDNLHFLLAVTSFIVSKITNSLWIVLLIFYSITWKGADDVTNRVQENMEFPNCFLFLNHGQNTASCTVPWPYHEIFHIRFHSIHFSLCAQKLGASDILFSYFSKIIPLL